MCKRPDIARTPVEALDRRTNKCLIDELQHALTSLRRPARFASVIGEHYASICDRNTAFPREWRLVFAQKTLIEVTNGQNEDQDLLKGLIRLHILHHASKEPFYGQWMIHELARHGYTLSPGTLYPMLHGLERRGYLNQRTSLRARPKNDESNKVTCERSKHQQKQVASEYGRVEKMQCCPRENWRIVAVQREHELHKEPNRHNNE